MRADCPTARTARLLLSRGLLTRVIGTFAHALLQSTQDSTVGCGMPPSISAQSTCSPVAVVVVKTAQTILYSTAMQKCAGPVARAAAWEARCQSIFCSRSSFCHVKHLDGTRCDGGWPRPVDFLLCRHPAIAYSPALLLQGEPTHPIDHSCARLRPTTIYGWTVADAVDYTSRCSPQSEATGAQDVESDRLQKLGDTMSEPVSSE